MLFFLFTSFDICGWMDCYRLASNEKDPDKTGSDVTYQLGMITKPNNGHYEATLVYSKKENRFHIRERDISRTNAYGDQPHCVSAKRPKLRKYCYCKKQISWNEHVVDCQKYMSSHQYTASFRPIRTDQTRPDVSFSCFALFCVTYSPFVCHFIRLSMSNQIYEKRRMCNWFIPDEIITGNSKMRLKIVQLKKHNCFGKSNYS